MEDSEAIAFQELETSEQTKIENNGSCEYQHDDDKLLANTKGEDVEVMEAGHLPLVTVRSPGGAVAESPIVTTKGYGLKKWRRIKRDFHKDGGSDVDTSKILKRGLSGSAVNSTSLQKFSVEKTQKSEGSVSSTNAMAKAPKVAVDGFAIHGLGLDPNLDAGPTFTGGADSESSEDQSSKSSTAASAPKSTYEMPKMVGNAQDKNKIMNLSGKDLGFSIQQGLQGKGRAESSKKPRGEQVKIEKENSHSSMESDSRSCNFVFMQGMDSVNSNGRQSGGSTNYGGENDEAQGGQQPDNTEAQSGFSTEQAQEFENHFQDNLAADLSWEVKEEKNENHISFTEQDPLAESILPLQSAQEALEKEIQKFREIGNGHILLFDDSNRRQVSPSEFSSVDPSNLEASSSDQLRFGEVRCSSSQSLESQVINLHLYVHTLESKLEEARDTLKEKQAKVIELEATLESSREMEAEVEGLFRGKIEAEVEYLAISRATQKLRVAIMDQVTLFKEQKTVALEQAQDVESKAMMLRRRAEELETYGRNLVERDRFLELHKSSVWKYASFFLIQFTLLVLVLVFVLQLSPRYAGVVPT